MKKILFLFITALLFASCSQDDSLTPPNTDGGELVDIKFSVGTAIKVESENLRSWFGDRKDTLDYRYIVYSADGDFLKENLYHAPNTSLAKFEITDKLPIGKYFIVLMASYEPNAFANKASKFVPNNYFTDEYLYQNTGMLYYESFAYEVVKNPAPRSITLSPMWTEIYVDLVGVNNIKLPAGVAYAEFQLTNAGKSFSLQSKTYTEGELVFAIPNWGLGTDRFNEEFQPIYPAQDIKFSVLFKDEYGDTLQTVDIVTFSAKRGQKVTIKGDIADLTSTFDIIINDSWEDVEVPVEVLT